MSATLISILELATLRRSGRNIELAQRRGMTYEKCFTKYPSPPCSMSMLNT